MFIHGNWSMFLRSDSFCYKLKNHEVGLRGGAWCWKYRDSHSCHSSLSDRTINGWMWKGALMTSVIWHLMTWTGHTSHIMAPCILRLGSPQLRHSTTKLLARAVLPCQQFRCLMVLICSTIFVCRQWQSLLGSISSSKTLPHPPMSPFWSIWTVQYDAILILTTVLYLWDWGPDHLTALRFSTTSTGNWSHGGFRWLSALLWHCQQVWVKTWQNGIKPWKMSDWDVAIKSYRIYSDGFGLQMCVLQLRQKLPRPKTLLGYLRLCTTPKGFQGANAVRKIPSKLRTHVKYLWKLWKDEKWQFSYRGIALIFTCRMDTGKSAER